MARAVVLPSGLVPARVRVYAAADAVCRAVRRLAERDAVLCQRLAIAQQADRAGEAVRLAAELAGLRRRLRGLLAAYYALRWAVERLDEARAAVEEGNSAGALALIAEARSVVGYTVPVLENSIVAEAVSLAEAMELLEDTARALGADRLPDAAEAAVAAMKRSAKEAEDWMRKKLPEAPPPEQLLAAAKEA